MDALIPVDLEPRARNFAAEYLVDFVVSRAADRAGISVSYATHLLTDFRVQALIQDGKYRHTEAINASVAMVLDRLNKIATANVVEAFSALESGEGTISKRLAALPEHVLYAIKSIEWTKHGPRVVMHDKIAALIQIGKFFGMFVDRAEISGPSGAPLPTITPTMSPQEAAEVYAATLRG